MNLRERKKERTRRAIGEAAVRLFAAQGTEATTVEAICAEAEVAISTFYVYFESKEAAAFAGADVRAEIVESILSERSRHEPLHNALRRASLSIVEEDLRHRDQVVQRLRLLEREPRLAAYAAQLQARYVERLTGVVANQMGVDPDADPRPRLVLAAVFGALNAAWATWAADSSKDLHLLVDQAHDTLDDGFRRALAR